MHNSETRISLLAKNRFGTQITSQKRRLTNINWESHQHPFQHIISCHFKKATLRHKRSSKLKKRYSLDCAVLIGLNGPQCIPYPMCYTIHNVLQMGSSTTNSTIDVRQKSKCMPCMTVVSERYFRP